VSLGIRSTRHELHPETLTKFASKILLDPREHEVSVTAYNAALDEREFDARGSAVRWQRISRHGDATAGEALHLVHKAPRLKVFMMCSSAGDLTALKLEKDRFEPFAQTPQIGFFQLSWRWRQLRVYDGEPKFRERAAGLDAHGRTRNIR
jgi:hypothetical protein